MRSLAALALAAVLASASAMAQPAPADICVPGYAREHRMSSAEAHEIKLDMMRREHPGEPLTAWILDHRIPLEIGGSNERGNLMLQSVAESRRKDRLEGLAHRTVCAGRMSLGEAWGWFEDWEASYRREFGGP